MHPFSIGDCVICIDDKPSPGRAPRAGEAWIKAGCAYRITATASNVARGNMVEYGVELAEVSTGSGSAGWHAWRFRKIDRAEDNFIKLLEDCRARAEAALFRDTVQAIVTRHRKTWAAPAGFKQGRAEHLDRLLLGYGEWFLGEFTHHPDAAHLFAVADLMFVWRVVPSETIPGMNPWVAPGDFPSICQAARCLATQRPNARRVVT